MYVKSFARPRTDAWRNKLSPNYFRLLVVCVCWFLRALMTGFALAHIKTKVVPQRASHDSAAGARAREIYQNYSYKSARCSHSANSRFKHAKSIQYRERWEIYVLLKKRRLYQI
jgi:hypothetical protein